MHGMANIKVAVRIRPISKMESHVTGSEVVVHAERQEISFTNLKVSSNKIIDSRERTKRYRFDYCFDSSDPTFENYASQMKIYDTLGQSLIDTLFAGYNACLVAYGQSASGKTYTMMGTNDDPGLIPRICNGLFLRAADEKKCGKMPRISVSYLEIYNEKVKDLLVSSTTLSSLRVREHPRLGPYVHGLTQHPVDTLNSLMSCVEKGSKTRKTASTLQNLTSSRSHALLTLTVDSGSDSSASQVAFQNSRQLRKTDFPNGSRLHLVDLAGSENSAANTGVNRLKSQEGANINKSLVALGNVISALAEQSSSSHTSTRRFIPYRDSTLTWLLKDSLGGNAATIILATISAASGSYNETSHTLRFAQRAQTVVHKPVINEDPVAKIIRELRDEIGRLKTLLLENNTKPIDIWKPSCVGERCQKQLPDHQSLGTQCVSTSSSISPAVKQSPLSEVGGERPGSIDIFTSKSQLGSINSSRQFGTLDIPSGFSDSENLRVTENYRTAKLSHLNEDKVDEPVFVDIPTLVAVLIKPDNNVKVDTHQIEEISSDGILEDNIDTDFNGSTTIGLTSLACDHFENASDNGAYYAFSQLFMENRPSRTDSINLQHSNCRILEEVENTIKEEPQLLNRDALDITIEPSSLPAIKKCQTSHLTESSPLLVDEEATVNIKKLKKFKKITQVKNSTGENIINEEQQLNVKEINERERSIESIRSRIYKNSNPSIYKNEQTLFTDILKHKLQRKNSLDSDKFSSKPHTIIHRPRRADIVAAVTERLYSSKKTPENTNTASTPVSDKCYRENSEVKLGTSTRMRLQEISRKMLAKRRKICVDTQTDSLSIIRVKDAGISVKEPKIMRKDASVLTDRHENYDILSPHNSPVLRVKEVATSTSDSPPPKQLIMMKDASNITEMYDNDNQIINFHHQDSGIMSDLYMSDTQTYAHTNFIGADISDFLKDSHSQSIEIPKVTETSSNTDIVDVPVNICAQTMKQDTTDISIEKSCELKCIKNNSALQSNSCCEKLKYSTTTPSSNNTYQRAFVQNTHCCPNICCESYRLKHDQPERSVISIALPDMINITIESPNVLESKIQVFDSNDQNQKDMHIRTEKNEFFGTRTSTTDNFPDYQVGDSSTRLNGNQGDTKTFRIENIFQNPHQASPRFPKVNENLNGLDNILSHTSPTETSFREISEDNLTCHSFRASTSPFAMRKKSTSRDWAELNMSRPGLHFNHENDSAQDVRSTAAFKDVIMEQPNKPQEVMTWRDIQMKNSTDENVTEKLDQLKISNVTVDSDRSTTKIILSNDNECCSLEKIPMEYLTYGETICGQEISFSDDSLDAQDERIKRTFEDMELPMSINNDMADLRCPPDVVAHTKKDAIDSLAFCDNTFISDDLNDTYVELPKAKLGIVSSASYTPVQKFDSNIVGVPMVTVADSREGLPKNIMETMKTKKKVSFGETSIVETDTPSSGFASPYFSHEFEINHKIESGENTCAHSFENVSNIQYQANRNVHYVDLIDLSNSNSDLENNRVSENSYVRKENILDEYMKEAMIYMRDNNTINKLTNSHFDEINKKKCSAKSRYRYSQSKNKNSSMNNESFSMEIGPYDKCLKSMGRLERCLNRVKRQDEILQKRYCMKVNASAETKFHLAKFSSDSVNNRWSCSKFRKHSSLDDLNRKHGIERDISSRRNFFNLKCDKKIDKDDYKDIDKILQKKLDQNHSKFQDNVSHMKKSRQSNCSRIETDHKLYQYNRYTKPASIYPILTENEEALIAIVQKSLPSPRCTISKYDSSNENSNSNDEFSDFIESIDQVVRPKDQFKYATSPRIKFLQLLNERRRIIESSRGTTAS